MILAPSTSFGREVAGRAAAALDAGLVGDAMGVDLVDGVLRGAEARVFRRHDRRHHLHLAGPARQRATGRPARAAVDGHYPAARIRRVVEPADRVRTLSEGRDDDLEVLARADAVIGVGSGVSAGRVPPPRPLGQVLGAEVAATRKVTDRGWMPRSRQIGSPGAASAPRLYVAIGLSGKFNHVVGVRLPRAPSWRSTRSRGSVFGHADVGIVGDWHHVIPLLERPRRHEASSAMADWLAGR